MTRPPFFIVPGALQGSRLRLGGDTAHRIQHTLRLQPGDPIRVGDGAGSIYDAELVVLGRGAIEAKPTGHRHVPADPPPRVELVHVLPKPALADRVLAPCTALGISAFRFARGDRTPVRGGGTDWSGRLERWGRIIRQACEQCERAWVPSCDLSDSLADCLAAYPAALRLVGDEARTDAEEDGLRTALAGARGKESVQWVIGPEGGFSATERGRFGEWGLHPVSLGPHILRLETAGVVAVTLLAYEVGRLGSCGGA